MNVLKMDVLAKLLCSRCCKRAVKAARLEHSDSMNEAKEMSDHCGLCLGILEDEQIQLAVEMITETVKEKYYDSSTFNLALNMPQSLVLRQKSLSSYISKNSNQQFPQLGSVKEELKNSVISEVEACIQKKYDNKSELLVNLIYKYKDDEKELSKLGSLVSSAIKSKKRKANGKNKNVNQPDNSISSITNAVAMLDHEKLLQYTVCPPETVSVPCKIDVTTLHGSIFVAGRYNKYSRELSQTPWLVDGGVRKTETSVQELICEKIQQTFSASDSKFLSSGREDVDVRMLGSGRPFATELIDPKRLNIPQADMTQLQKDINASTELIAVHDLQIVSRDALKNLKEGEEEKTKKYSAKIWCPVPITDDQITKLNAMKSIELAQKTPLRVMHRRTIYTRKRTVFNITMTRIDEEHYNLILETEAGTYIKEFVHSDFGRTEPSMCTLLDAPFYILELDVDAIELSWPTKIEE